MNCVPHLTVVNLNAATVRQLRMCPFDVSCRDRMLPAEAFKPRSPPRTQNQGQYSSYHDDQYDDYYGRGNHNTAYGSSSNYEVIIAVF